MSLEEALRRVEHARGEFTRAQADTSGWSDQQRSNFDSQRLRPLIEVSGRVTTALTRAREQCEAAERLLQ